MSACIFVSETRIALKRQNYSPLNSLEVGRCEVCVFVGWFVAYDPYSRLVHLGGQIC